MRLHILKKWLEVKVKLSFRHAEWQLNYQIAFLVQAFVLTLGHFYAYKFLNMVEMNEFVVTPVCLLLCRVKQLLIKICVTFL